MKPQLRVRRGVVLFGGVLLLSGPSSVVGQSLEHIELVFAPFQAELHKGDSKAEKPLQDFWKALDLLRAEDRRQRFNGKISVGLSGNETGIDDDSLFKLDTGLELKRGPYPGELTFTLDTSLELKGKALQENVSKFAASYEYHHTNWVEYYAFAERFTDNFLAIQQRYETGFGAMFGGNMLPMKEWNDNAVVLGSVGASSKTVQALLDESRLSGDCLRGRTRPGDDDYKELARTTRYLTESLRARQSHLFLGIAFSVFSELEQAKIEAHVLPEAQASTGLKTKQFSLDAEHRFRWTARPTAIVRPTEDLEIALYPYIKLPLDGPRSVPVDGKSRLDYRLDLLSAVTWNLSKNVTGSETVDFTFKFERHVDNVPPRVLQDTLDAEPLTPVLTRTVAPRRHDVLSMQLNVKWGD